MVDSLEKELQDASWDNAEDLRSALLTDLRSSLQETQTRAVSLALGGVTILRKGEFDLVTNGADVFKLLYRGSPRRCGGQGDILAGCLGVAFYWASKVHFTMSLDGASGIDTLLFAPTERECGGRGVEKLAGCVRIY